MPTARGSATQGVAQLAYLQVGRAAPPALRSQADVLAAGLRSDVLQWPGHGGAWAFNLDYAGSVQRALLWGLAGGEGTSGWTYREYQPSHFDAIGNAAAVATGFLDATPALANDDNRTLVAIRAFRGPATGAMAGQTLNDLQLVHGLVNGLALALNAAGLVNNPAAALVSFEASAAEAHPNTLPTAKVTYAGGQTVYFKGRGHAAEDALVGSGPSGAVAISSLGGAAPGGPQGVGTHGFLDPRAGGPGANTNQIAKDVGPAAAPVLAPTGYLESARTWLPSLLGGAHVPPRLEAVDAWVSAAKTALLVSLTATSDLHASNIVTGANRKANVIDGEFLLDATWWQAYQDMLANGTLANFDVTRFVPRWLSDHTRSQSAGTKALMADAVETAFLRLNADKTHAWLNIVAPFRALLQTPALLRVAPIATDELLVVVSSYHNRAGAPARAQLMTYVWNEIVNSLAGVVVPANAVLAQGRLDADFANGMVPLFHVQANNGDLLLDKVLVIGRMVHSPTDLLELAGKAVSAQYQVLATAVRRAVAA